MARHWFGGTHADVVVQPWSGFQVAGGARLMTLRPGHRVTFWDAPVNGSRYTDLLLDGTTPAQHVESDEHGYSQRLQGPDGVQTMWADVGDGSPRRLMVTTDAAIDLSTQLATRIPTSEKGTPSGVATLDAGGMLPEAQVPTRLTDAELTAKFARKGEPGADIRDWSSLAVGDDWGAAIQAALNELVPTTDGRVFTLYFPEGRFLSNQQLTSPHAVHIHGTGRMSTIIGIGQNFPSGGTLFSFTRSADSRPSLETHVPGLAMKGLTLDGRLRSIQAHALRFHRFNRMDLEIGVNAFNGSALRAAHSLYETHLGKLRTWLCGNASSPAVDIDQAFEGTSTGANLNHFIGCHILYSLGDQLRVRGASGVVVRHNFFTDCVFHGIEEWLDDYYDDFGAPITLDHEGNSACRIVLDNARNSVFDNCRVRQNGRGQPNLLLSDRAAGSSTNNSASMVGTGLTFRGGAYSARTVSAVDAAADTMELAGINTNRHHFQTGSRVRFIGTGLPAPLAANTDYYTIRTSATAFKVATSRANALAGTAIDLTSATTGATIYQLDTAATVDTAADALTALDHRLTTGARFRVVGTALPGGLAANTDYFVIRVDKDTLKLATTRANAEAGTAIDLTSTGTEVAIAPQDFLGDVERGTLRFDGNIVDLAGGGTNTRGLFRIGSPGILRTGLTNDWPVGPGRAVAEYASGSAHPHHVDGLLTLTRNNEGIFVTRSDGATVQALRMTTGNEVQFGSLSGTDNAAVVGATLARVVGGGSERFRAGAGGLSFNGVTTLVSRRTVNAAATDLSTTTDLTNQLRQLLIDLGLAQ